MRDDVEDLEARVGGEQTGSVRAVKKVALAAFVGSTVEWYDFFLYGTAAALVFGDLFFPDANPTVGTLAAFATFGVGFLFRPLGGAFFGHFGDRVGRKAMLVITLLLMGSATVAIGLLPTYNSVGLLAPILLVLLRAIQGFSVGGEWAGGSLMTIEYAPPERRGFYGAWPQVGPSAGSLLATGAFALFNTLPEDQFNAWGWRVPFLLSAVVVIVGLLIRMRLAESPVFKEAKKQDVPTEKPFVTAFRDHKRPIFLIMGMRLAINTTFYVATVFALSYGDDQLGIPKGQLLAGVLITSALGFVTKPIYGHISDSVGRRPIYGLGSITGALFAVPFFLMLESQSFALILIGMFLLINVSHDLNDAIESSFFCESFDTEVRYTGAAMGHQLGGAITGFTPLIAGGLSAAAGDAWWPVALYVVVACLISAACVYASRETLARKLLPTPERSAAPRTGAPMLPAREAVGS
jgi:MFS transporter, MHS family, shikimate and dehydroshikimate transport protein